MAYVTIDHCSASWVVSGPVIQVSIFCVSELEVIVIPTWFKAKCSTAAACDCFTKKNIFACKGISEPTPFSPVLKYVSLKNKWPSAVYLLHLSLKLPWAACWSLHSHLRVPRWPAAVRPATSAVGFAVRPQAWKTASSLAGETWTHLRRHCAFFFFTRANIG